MEIIPAINTNDDGEAERLLTRAAHFLPHGGWIHIDVGDGVYTPLTAGGSAAAYGAWLLTYGLNAEVHLMADDYEDRVVPWLDAGAKRIIIPVALVRDAEYVLELEKKYAAAIMLSCGLDINFSELKPFFRTFHLFQVLAVKPGISGQLFYEGALSMIQLVRAALPHAIIEVDGGITPSVARRVRNAGADIVVSSSYIWGSKEPKKAYEELCSV